jgi:gliding motility-associated-like protein
MKKLLPALCWTILFLCSGKFSIAQVWVNSGNNNTVRQSGATALLQDGRVLVTGGYNAGAGCLGETNAVDIYDPITNTWTAAAPMTNARTFHSATLLKNGKVLIAGGGCGGATCEIFDPSTNTWSPAASMSTVRNQHSATLLRDGRVLVAGGCTNMFVASSLVTCEIYDPVANTWTATGSMTTARAWHTGVLMSNGRVMVDGGVSAVVTPNCEIYNPASGTWAAATNDPFNRAHHCAVMFPDGRIMEMGGDVAGFGTSRNFCNIYNPTTNTWVAAAPMIAGRDQFNSLLLPNGKVMVLGGDNGAISIATCEYYTIALNTWAAAPLMISARSNQSTVLLADGRVLAICGSGVAATEILDYGTGTMAATGSMVLVQRGGYQTVMLPNGKVLICGGLTAGSTTPLKTCELYDPVTGTWAATGSMNHKRMYHTATLLDNGKVLVTGGQDTLANVLGGPTTNTAELYNPATGTWTLVSNMNAARWGASATLLFNGNVLIAAGGFFSVTSEIFDPNTNLFTPTGNLSVAHTYHTATLLPNGKVLVASSGPTGNACELYDPCAGTWSLTAALPAGAGSTGAEANLLRNGKVMYEGGAITAASATGNCYLYDYTTGLWTPTGTMITTRGSFANVLMPNGKVFVAGGYNGGVTPNAEVYDFVTGTWTATAPLPAPKTEINGVYLPSGKILIPGGDFFATFYTTASLFDSGLGYANLDRPVITSIAPTTISQPSMVLGFTTITVTGTGFKDNNNRKGTEASSGNYQNSATNFPIVQIDRMGGSTFDNDYMRYLAFDIAPANTWDSTVTKIRFPYGITNQLPSGIYALRVISNGVPSLPVYLTVNMACGIIANFTTSPVCIGATTVFTNTCAGTPSTCWKWRFGDNTTSTLQSPTHVYASAGTYNVTLIASNDMGCVDSITLPVTVNPLPTIVVTPSSISVCASLSATLVGSGATSYVWSPGASLNTTVGTTVIATPASTTTYTLTGTDGNGCVSTATSTVTVNPVPTISATTSNVSCNGGSNGSSNSSVVGGTPAYTYLWSGGQTTANVSGLPIGTYSVVVTDANGCMDTVSVTITQPTAITSSVSAQSNVLCNGGNTGSATVSPSGGTPGYTYSWAPSGGTSATATNLTAQIYTVTITDLNGCAQTQLITITEPTALTSSVSSQTTVLCNGGNTGSATVSPSGGTPGYTYSWAPSGGTSATATNLTAQIYTVTITDLNGCAQTQLITITEPTALTSSVSSQTNVLCNGGNTGSATVSPSGGTPGYTYSWAPSGGTGATANNLTAQIYTVTITDLNGCVQTQNVTITEPTALTSSVSSQTNVSCNGGNTGSATISPSGGTPGYTYSWAPSGGTGATATNLTAQVYTVTITDLNGCVQTQNVTITQPTAITSSVSAQTNVLCNGGNTGSATISPSGGTPGYTYSWAPSGGTNATATNLTAQIYTVTITDLNGCAQTQLVTITEPTVITSSVSSQSNALCNGGNTGSATISPSGGTPGYTYSWAPSGGTNATATNLTAQVYTVTITDLNGCIQTQLVTITEPTVITSFVSSQSNALCNGGNTGSATISPSGGTPGYTYSWAPFGGTSATATNLTAQVYTVTITDLNGCVQTQNVTITEPTPITSSVTSQTDELCNGGNNGSATIAPVGGTPGYTYSWAPFGGTSATATNLTAQIYTVTITDLNGCTQIQNITITQPTAITSSVSAQSNVLCNGGNTGNATISPSGGTPGYTYSWAPSGGTNATATNLTAQIYTVTITDLNGCTQTQLVSITEPSVITSSISTQTNVLCNGGNTGSATISPSGGTPGYTYSWAPSGGTNATANNLTAQIYTVTITDLNGCTQTQTVSITEPTPLTSSITNQTDLLCNGVNTGSATVLPSGGTGPFTYNWSPSGGNASTANGLSAINYTVTVTDNNGCITTSTVSLTQPTAISITTSTTQTACSGNTGTATTNVSGGTGAYSYSWNPGGQTTITATGLGVGTYTVTITDANGCVQTQIATVTTVPSTLAATTTSTPAGCTVNNGTATATASGGSGPYTYSWSPSGGTNATAIGLASGNYTCTVTDANGCSVQQTILVATTSGPIAFTGNDTTIIIGGTATLFSSGGGTYNWSPSSGLSCTTCTNPTVSPLSTTSYCVMVTDTNGCADTSCVTVFVDVQCGTIFVPNAFSPNGDGMNDVECVLGNCIQSMYFAVYDRWGEKVFESNDAKTCWDGTYKGEMLNTAVFVYYLNATLVNGEVVTQKGNISLVR